MTLRSQNGFTANDRSLIASYTIPGTEHDAHPVKVALRKGDTSVVLLDIAGFIHAEVEDLSQKVLDDWGYAERTIRGSSTTLSNHASGTALDIDARKHSLGVEGTWTAAQKRKIHARLKLYDDVVRWGEDYHGRVDGMHFEINAGKTAVAKVADRIRGGHLAGGALSYMVGRKPFTAGDHPTLRVGDTGRHVAELQQLLGVKAEFGPETERAVKALEREHGLEVNGVAGDSVWRALGK